MSHGSLNGSVVIITGAGRGIGEAGARLFARAGAKVVLSDRDKAPVEAVAYEIREEGGDAIAVAGDVTDPGFPAELVEEAIAKYGELHVLVNNAGYTWDGMTHKMTDEQWEAMLTVHNTAPFRLIRAAAPHMREAGKAEMAEGLKPQDRVIINISSTSGLHGNAGQANYSTAKAGILGLTKTIAKEWGPFGVRCNAIAYGFIQTRLTAAKESGESIEVDGKEIPLGIPSQLQDMVTMMIPLGRTGEPEEAGGAMVLLASPYARYITGHCLEVTGGLGI